MINKTLRCCLFLSILIANSTLALTDANTLITNQAIAVYIDIDGEAQQVYSNAVRTRVQSVFAISLEQNNSKQSLAGNIVRLSHFVTNQGNAEDAVSLTVENVQENDLPLSNIQIFRDQDINGIADDAVPVTGSNALAQGESFHFIIEATVPSNSANGSVLGLIIQATSVNDASQIDTNRDQINIVDDAIVEVTQTLSRNQGSLDSGLVEIRIDYINRGSRAATNLSITNTLPSVFNYFADSAFWSQENASLTDNDLDTQGESPAIIYCAYQSNCNSPNQIEITIDEVGAGQSGSITFNVAIAQDALPATYFNQPEFVFTNDANQLIDQLTINPAPFVLIAQTAVELTSAIINDAAPGTRVQLSHTLTNAGDQAAQFNLRFIEQNSSFPEGTGFIFLDEDGITPLNDSNFDGFVDTALIPANTAQTVIVSVTLPTSISSGSYQIPIQATDFFDQNTFAEALAEVNVNSPPFLLDLTLQAASGAAGCNQAADNCGFGAFNESLPPLLDLTIAPSTTLPIFIKNYAAFADTYSVSVFADKQSLTPLSTLSATFQNGSNQAITSTQTLTENQSIQLTLTLTTLTNTPVLTEQPLYIRIQSQANEAEDWIKVSFTTLPSGSIDLSPNNVLTGPPDRAVIARHILQNNFNQPIELTAFNLINSAAAPWLSRVVVDSDTGSVNQYGPEDTPLDNARVLSPGESITLFVWTFIPSNAAEGQSQTIQLEAIVTENATPLIVSNQITTVPLSVDIIKQQAPDLNCDGIADQAYSPAQFSAVPGSCILYEIMVINEANTPALNAVIDDATPIFTRFSDQQPNPNCVPDICQAIQPPIANSVGALRIEVGDLMTGQSVRYYFSVKVDSE